MKILSYATILSLFLAMGTAFADVSLNEFRVDQPGADVDEFVELFSAGGMSLDGISFVILQDNGSIDGVVDLTGSSIAAGDVFLIGETATLPGSSAMVDLMADLNLENGENSSYLLVNGFTGMVGTDLDTDDDGVFDVALPWGSIIDGIALVDDEDTILDGGTEDINYGPALGVSTLGPDGTFYPSHVFASVDGGGIDTIGSFFGDDDTPGQLNVIPEPTSTGIACMMMVGLGLARRRK